MRAKVLRDPVFVQYSQVWMDIAILTNLLFWQGAGQYWNASKLFANHNALGQLTNHNTFRFSEGGLSSNPELIESFVSGWGERNCNNENYVKNNAIFEPPSMRACSSTPPKQNQDFVKEHNRTPLNTSVRPWVFGIYFRQKNCSGMHRKLSESICNGKIILKAQATEHDSR